MKKLLYTLIFVLIFAISASTAIATCIDGNATCLGPKALCSSIDAHDSSGTCMVGSFAGHCCSPGAATTGTGGTNAWGNWGNPPLGTSLTDFKNLLGANAPKNASTASWENVLSTTIAFLILIAVVLSLAYLFFGGFNWIFSGGDKEKLAKARQNVIFAVVGLIIVFLAATVISVAGTFFGVTFLNLP